MGESGVDVGFYCELKRSFSFNCLGISFLRSLTLALCF